MNFREFPNTEALPDVGRVLISAVGRWARDPSELSFRRSTTLVGTRRNYGKTKDGTGLLEIYCLVI